MNRFCPGKPWLACEGSRILSERVRSGRAADYALTFKDAFALPGHDGMRKSRIKKRGDLLAPREREVAALIAKGLSKREIATRLTISERTGETHVQHILNKLGAGSRSQIATWAVQHGLLAQSPE